MSVILIAVHLVRGHVRQEGCGSGYDCTHSDKYGYGCASLFNESKMICCSAGQAGQNATSLFSEPPACVQCPAHGPCHLQPGQIPVCPYGKVTESGCVRAISDPPNTPSPPISTDPASTQSPPIWPDTFSVSFIETLNGSSAPYITQNSGRWFYDWPNRRSRFDHDKGHRNDFCVLSGLQGASYADCRLYFTSDLQLWIALPEKRTCCTLCKPNPHGFPATCSTMLPNWLANSSYKGQVKVGANECNWFSKPGAVATDNWYATPDEVPCQYREHYPHQGANIDNITDHLILFNRSTYSTGPIPNETFALPSYCNADCNFPEERNNQLRLISQLRNS